MIKTTGKARPDYYNEHRQVSSEFPKINAESIILAKWTMFVIDKLNPLNKDLFLLSDDSVQPLIFESQREQEKARALLVETLFNNPGIRDKQQYVQIHQALLIRLLDKLHSFQQNKLVTEVMIRLYDTVSQHLQNTLDFIEDFFSNYFDRNEKVPVSYLIVYKEEIKRKLKKIIITAEKNENVDKVLLESIIQYVDQFTNDDTKAVSYFQLAYHKDLLNELLTEKILGSTEAIRETLYYHNFNDDNYIALEYERLNRLTENLPTKKEKISLLNFEKKNINQLSTKLNCTYTKFMPSLKDQINGWIDEEVKFLESEHLPEKISEIGIENESKIHTSLSVAKLALLIRLLVIDKIIINRTVAPMLRIVAKIFTTLQREEISFGSLETKYHAPDKGTINAVRDILFKWINILNRL